MTTTTATTTTTQTTKATTDSAPPSPGVLEGSAPLSKTPGKGGAQRPFGAVVVAFVACAVVDNIVYMIYNYL